MQQVTQSHSCRLEARDESEEEQDTLAHPQATSGERQRRGKKKKRRRKAEEGWKDGRRSVRECEGDSKKKEKKKNREGRKER